jgi:hypothetical protein
MSPRLAVALFAVAGCAGGPIGGDDAMPDGAVAPDLAMSAVGPGGGAVDRLFFAMHGDTRPPDCDQTGAYPTDIIRSIFQREHDLGVQFAVDLGDHMFVCNNSVDEAQTQMKMYMDASQLLGKTTFMTMGNHECAGGNMCSSTANDANSTVYRQALAPIAALPYYSFDVMTSSGKATFVIVADNFWDGAQQQWLEATLTRADAEARYTIVARHHPIDNKDLQNPQMWQVIRAHKYTLFLTGHSHVYSHDTWLDPSGRTLRLGVGGAPLASGQSFYGFGAVQQNADGSLAVTIYDQATMNPQDSFTVAPQ